MRKLLIILVALAVVAVAPARAQAATVTITMAGFVPSAVTIDRGDSVTWINADTADHQVASDKARFSSPILGVGESFTFTFKASGSFRIKDILDKSLKGTIVVKSAPAPPRSVTLSASTLRVVYSAAVTLSGRVSSRQAGESVTILAQRFGDAAFSQLAAVKTGDGGGWSYRAKPTIGTSYQARWESATSSSLTVGVRPLVAFRVLANGRFSSKVVAARSFAGRFVQLQRRSSFGQWVTIKRARLNASSAAVLRATLPRSTSTLRVAMSVNQAGSGYLGGISRTIVYYRG